MDLTEEQRAVVEIDEGRHRVLVPPGSGKTEMLSQRILRALRREDLSFSVTHPKEWNQPSRGDVRGQTI